MALAEFNALRAEILTNISAQTTSVGLGVTAIGVLIGFVATKDGDQHLLLAIPFVSLLVVMLHGAATYRIGLLGNYIRVELWPFLAERLQPLPLPSWESRVAERRLRRTAFTKATLVDLPPLAIFIVASGVALLVAEYEALWWVGAGLTLASIAVPIALGILIRTQASSLEGKRSREQSPPAS